MEKIFSTLNVFFQEPFWIGVYERRSSDGYEVCKITFGAEPKDFEVYEFLLKSFSSLVFSHATCCDVTQARRANPKRIQREISRFLQEPKMSTKAQAALSLQHELAKETRKKRSREQKDEEKKRRFLLKHEKRKEKRAGH